MMEYKERKGVVTLNHHKSLIIIVEYFPLRLTHTIHVIRDVWGLYAGA